MRRKRFIGNQIVALVVALVFLCCMMIPCLSLTWRWEEADETPEPMDVAMNMFITHQKVVVDDYVEGIGHDEAAGKWKDISCWQLAQYTWDAGYFLGDKADKCTDTIKRLNDELDQLRDAEVTIPAVVEQLEKKIELELSVGTASRFASIVAFCVSVSLFGAFIGLVITIIYLVVKILLALFSEKMATALADDETSGGNKKEGKRNPFGAFISAYCILLLCHHLFGMSLQALQNIYVEKKYSDLTSSLPECNVDLVFSGGVHWLILIVLCAVMFVVGQFIVQKIFRDSPPVSHTPVPDSEQA